MVQMYKHFFHKQNKSDKNSLHPSMRNKMDPVQHTVQMVSLG